MVQQRCIKLTYSVWGSKTGSCGEQACKCASVCVFVAFVINGNIRQLKDTHTHTHTSFGVYVWVRWGGINTDGRCRLLWHRGRFGAFYFHAIGGGRTVDQKKKKKKLKVAVMPDGLQLGHDIGGMRFCRSRGVELKSERVLPTKQREAEKEERERRERDGWAGCSP